MKKLTICSISFLVTILGMQAAMASDSVGAVCDFKNAIERVENNPIDTKSVSDFSMASFYEALLVSSLNTNNPHYLASLINKANQAGWKLSLKKYDAKDYAVAGVWAKIQALSNDKKILNFAIRDMLKIADSQNSDDTSIGKWSSSEQLFGGAYAFSNMYSATKNKKFLSYLDFRFKQSIDPLLKSSKISDKALVLQSLCSILENAPTDWDKRSYYEDLFVKEAQNSTKINLGDFSASVHITGSQRIANAAFISGALAWGVNNGLLDLKKFKDTIEKDFSFACLQEKKISDSNPFSIGALICAKNQIDLMLGKNPKKADFDELFAKAKEILLDKSSTASFAKLEPRRADDIAWENDKTAYRAYGPALEKSVENAGFDIWGKTVSYPVIQKWYDEDLSKIRSYHNDNGEGMDSYKVANSTGIGGTVIFEGDAILRSNVYKAADVFWTKPNRAKFGLNHHYKFKDETITTEFKTVNINSGDNFFEVSANLRDGVFFETVIAPSDKSRFPKKTFNVGIGILCQNPKAEIVIAPDNSYMYVIDKMAGKKLVQFVAVSKSTKIVGSKISDFDSKLKEVFIVVNPNSKGEYSYKAGYFFEGRDKNMPEDFDKYLKEISK